MDEKYLKFVCEHLICFQKYVFHIPRKHALMQSKVLAWNREVMDTHFLGTTVQKDAMHMILVGMLIWPSMVLEVQKMK